MSNNYELGVYTELDEKKSKEEEAAKDVDGQDSG